MSGDNRRSAEFGQVPEVLPMNSVKKGSVQAAEPFPPLDLRKTGPRPLSVIYSQNEMLESQTVTLIGQTTAEHEPSILESGKMTEQANNEDLRVYRRGTA